MRVQAFALAIGGLTPIVLSVSCGTDHEQLFGPVVLELEPAGSSRGGVAGSDDLDAPRMSPLLDGGGIGGNPSAGVGGRGGRGLSGAAATLPGAATDDAGSDSARADGGDRDAGASSAAPLPPNDNSCGRQCVQNGGRCFQGTCFFDCDQPDSCSDQVLCPPGRPCEVTCGTRACSDSVVCGVGAECNIRCEGELSCARQVICSASCDVTCSGERSCRGGVGGSVERLALDCSGPQSCSGNVSCEGLTCQLSCSGAQSCPRVNTFAIRNSLSCQGQGSCMSSVTCNGGTCGVECGDGTCGSGVNCQALICNVEPE
jgi:hypothetical protein